MAEPGWVENAAFFLALCAIMYVLTHQEQLALTQAKAPADVQRDEPPSAQKTQQQQYAGGLNECPWLG